MKKTVKKGTIFEKEVTKIFINGENTMTCRTLSSLKDILVVRSMEYLFPQVGQKRL